MPDTPAATAGPRITVALLPTLHRLHLEPAFAHYDFTVIRRIILAFGPDAICGEVRPIDWQRTAGGTRPGYCGPVEYRQLILPLCRERGIPFHPVDDYPDEPDAGSGERAGPADPGDPKPEPRPVGGGGMPLASVAGPPVPAAWQTAAEATWQDVTQTFLQWIGRRELGLRAIFEQGVMDLIRAKHRLQLQLDATEEIRTWSVRNLRMAANILDACASVLRAGTHAGTRHLRRRVLVTVGLEHVPVLWDLLQAGGAVDLWPVDWPLHLVQDRLERPHRPKHEPNQAMARAESSRANQGLNQDTAGISETRRPGPPTNA